MMLHDSCYDYHDYNSWKYINISYSTELTVLVQLPPPKVWKHASCTKYKGLLHVLHM